MADRELAALQARFELSESARDRLGIMALALTNDPRAPVAGRPPRPGVLDEHLADSLVALSLRSVREATHMVDIGSGAGLPALPLAIARPDLQVVALESNARKAGFITALIDRCELANAKAVAARAEAWDEGRDRFDLAVTRALAPLEVVAEYAAPLLHAGGTLVAWRGRRDQLEERAAQKAAEVLGLEPTELRQVFPFLGAQHRHLHVLRKVRPTPERFPRRIGVALKRPLGASV